MKKLISLLLAFAMIVSMAGCTSGSPQENTQADFVKQCEYWHVSPTIGKE